RLRTREVQAAGRAAEIPVLGPGHRRQTRHRLRRPGRRRQGRNDQALHRTPQSACGPRRRTQQALGPGSRPMVLPALCLAPAHDGARTTPSDRAAGQCCVQRYVSPPPTSGGIVMLDRSWYNRAKFERVMGFCTDEEYETFMEPAPVFEKMLIDSGVHVTKFWFSVTQREQRTRFAIRQIDPVRRWKLSPMDLESLDRWEDYTKAKEATFRRTDTDHAPWITIKSNDKKRA